MSHDADPATPALVTGSGGAEPAPKVGLSVETHDGVEGVDFYTQEDVQCGRCGSSMLWEDCGACDDGQVECGDPIQCCDGTHACTQCLGAGGWETCLSSAEWCLANPRKGHEETPRHTAEVFTYREPIYAD